MKKKNPLRHGLCSGQGGTNISGGENREFQ